MARARVVAISNQKGGVGKTTTAVNLGAALALMHRKVLVIDLDPQGNATSGLGYPHRVVGAGLYDLLMDAQTFESVKLTTEIEGLHILPADRDLVGAEIELVGADEREYRLKALVEPLREFYDDILIDCPPSLGLLTVNALVACDSVLVPLQAEYYAMEGLSALLNTIDQIKRSLNPLLVREGIVVTMSDIRNNLCKEVEAQARAEFGEGVLRTVIPRNVRLGVAPSWSKPLVQMEPKSPGARAYFSLAEELLTRRGTTVTPYQEAV
jgi:chromosome partitioning protein